MSVDVLVKRVPKGEDTTPPVRKGWVVVWAWRVESDQYTDIGVYYETRR